MNVRLMVLSCLIGVVVLSMGYEASRTPFIAFGNTKYSQAAPKADRPSLKIGVVDIQKIFDDCKRNVKYREEAFAEQSRFDAETERLSKEIEAQKAGLKMLKPGSSDYLTQFKAMLEKQAKLVARREFNEQRRALKRQQWVEELYKEILQVIGELAEQNTLDLVFEKDEPDFTLSGDDLMLAIRLHKLLYSGGNCLDITDKVIARLDAEENAKQ